MTSAVPVVLKAKSSSKVDIALGLPAAADLYAGRLTRPPVAYAYYVVCPEAAAETPKIKAFTAWLLDEAQAG